MNNRAREILAQAPVVPVITIDNPDHAVPLARALLAGGVPVLEVTLRTAAGLESIRRLRAAVPEAIVGAGTVLNPAQFEQALAAGSQFVISPGITPALLAAGTTQKTVPFMPGIATVSELMQCLDAGLDTLKFFPAGSAGGVAMLKAMAGPFADVRFCPTGGISLANMAEYLRLPQVLSVGGSWLTPPALMAAGDWAAITTLAAEAVAAVAALQEAPL